MRLHLRSLMGLTALLMLVGGMAMAQNDNVFTCSSDNGRLHSCRVNTDRPIQFVRQLSSAQCVEGQSYGIDRGGVWVTDGCRADFAVVNSDRAYNDNGYYNSQGTYNNGGYYDRDNDRDRDGYRDQNGNWHSRHHRHDNSGAYSQNGPYNRPSNNNGSYSGTYRGPYNNGGYYNGGYNGGYVGNGQQHPTTYYGKYDNGKTTCSATQGAGPVYCQTDGALSDATVIYQNGRCQRGQTWDINPDGLWVADGCSAQFRIQR